MSAERLSPEAAAARINTRDSIGIPLATGQPGAFMEALGTREDWEELCIYGALLAVFSLPSRIPMSTTCPGSSVRSNAGSETRAQTSASRPPTFAASLPSSRHRPRE